MRQGSSDRALGLLNAPPVHPNSPQFSIPVLTLEGIAYARLHRFVDADQKLGEAGRLCATAPSEASCGGVPRARGILALEEGKFSDAHNYFETTLAFARSQRDQFLESTALLNLGATALQQSRFDEAIDWSKSAYQLSTALGAEDVNQVAIGNLGWAYYKLGDSAKALDSFVVAEKGAERLGHVLGQVEWLTTAGYVYLDRSDYRTAEQSYQKALTLAQQITAKEYIRNALMSLALVSQRENKSDEATRYSDQAIATAKADGNRLDELYPLLVKGQVAAQLHDSVRAAAIFREVATDPQSDSSLKWEAEHSLARLDEDEGQRIAAGREYEASLCTFETARSSVHHEESKLPFFSNASRIYDDYIAFLVKSGEANRALEVADFSRGRTLAEGLGLLRNERPCATPPLNPERVAATAEATVLYYWMGQQQSYLWAITGSGVRVFVLPPAAQIDSSARRYREALVSGEDVVATSNQEGLQLYQQLVMPAIPLLANAAGKRSKQRLSGEAPRVIVVPDGSLNSLNFETLLVPGTSGPHYWIEDAVISDAQSLRLLSAGKRKPESRPARMLLVGDAIPHNPEYPALPNAKQEIENVEKHFAPADLTVYMQASATAAAFIDSKPEQYDYIHFVAHAVASSQVPLDSAVILSPRPGEESFKLYAREIIQHSLRARLVTVSACYGAGTRSYNGEGLIGLSWAFLRAGARNTIGALWEVNDASTPQLMDYFYAELQQGRSPDVALRAAKLSLIESNKILKKPFYWAPFQLYGSA